MAVEDISSWQFHRKDSQATFNPPCKSGWITTLNAVKLLWQRLKREGFSYFSPRSINQDPLEHFFGCIRANCGCNTNPTVSQFVSSLKTSLINGLSFKGVIGGNCEAEPDAGSLLSNLHLFLDTAKSFHCVNAAEAESDVQAQTMKLDKSPELDNPEVISVAYVSGYIARRNLIENPCVNCRRALTSNSDELLGTGLEFCEYSVSNSGLTYPSMDLIFTVGQGATISERFMCSSSHLKGVKERLSSVIAESLDWQWIEKDCSIHFLELRSKICDGICSIAIPWWCKLQNRSFVAERSFLKRKMRILSHV